MLRSRVDIFVFISGNLVTGEQVRKYINEYGLKTDFYIKPLLPINQGLSNDQHTVIQNKFVQL
jgi:hypothetical protein